MSLKVIHNFNIKLGWKAKLIDNKPQLNNYKKKTEITINKIIIINKFDTINKKFIL